MSKDAFDRGCPLRYQSQQKGFTGVDSIRSASCLASAKLPSLVLYID
jgi:hypothetical protein